MGWIDEGETTSKENYEKTYESFICIPSSSIHPITHNFFRQFWNVTFNKIVCQLCFILILWNTSLVHSFWYFWLATLAFKCQLASSARRAARSALPSAGPTVHVWDRSFVTSFFRGCFVSELPIGREIGWTNYRTNQKCRLIRYLSTQLRRD